MVEAVRCDDSTEMTTESLNMAAQAIRFTTKYYVILSVTMIKICVLAKAKERV